MILGYSFFSEVEHYYKSHRYDEAIAALNNQKQTKPCLTKKTEAMINLWLGKCFFQKTEITHCYTPCRFRGFSPYRNQIDYLTYRKEYNSKRMVHLALPCLDRALTCDPGLGSAYYWKGEVLRYQGKIHGAYRCFIEAARLLQDQNSRKIVRQLFASYPELPFLETRNLESVTIEEALAFCCSDSPYKRMEGCHRITHFLGKLSNEAADKVKQVMSSLYGYQIFCQFIPGLGDRDIRVRQKAQSILAVLCK